jgi:hypothetical protein
MLTALVLTACSSGSKASLGAFAEECSTTAPCGKNLICPGGTCTAACQSNLQCNQLQSGAVCYQGYCYAYCHDKSNCPNGLDCVLTSGSDGVCKLALAPGAH